MNEVKQIRVSEILLHLKNGVTRFTDSDGYDERYTSIMEIYNLDKATVTEIFQHPKLKHRKTIKPKLYELIDDVTETTTNVVQEPQVQAIEAPAVEQLAQQIEAVTTPVQAEVAEQNQF